MADKKPAGWSAFDRLMKQLVTAPKETVDARIAAAKAARPKRKRKKK